MLRRLPINLHSFTYVAVPSERREWPKVQTYFPRMRDRVRLDFLTLEQLAQITPADEIPDDAAYVLFEPSGRQRILWVRRQDVELTPNGFVIDLLNEDLIHKLNSMYDCGVVN